MLNPLRLLPATLLLALLLLGAVSPAGAAGGDVEVVSDDARTRFPEGVSFSVAAEGSSDIVEVKLNFRNAHGGPWSYAYLDVAPSPSVETAFTLGSGGDVYIPPEAEIEYFYTIRDADGAATRTPRRTVFYSDNRFRWESITVGPLVLLHHDQPRGRARALEEGLRRSIPRVQDLLGVSPERPMRGVIYNSGAEAAQAFPHLSDTIDASGVFQGFAFSEWNLFTGIGLSEDLIVHEAAHLLLHEATKDSLRGVPTWFNEGFAGYVEPGSRPYPALFLERSRPSAMPLRAMGSVPGRREEIGFFYRKSESVVGHLIETHGEDRFRGLLARVNARQPFDDALYETYGFDLDGLEREWLGLPPGSRENVQAPAPQPPAGESDSPGSEAPRPTPLALTPEAGGSGEGQRGAGAPDADAVLFPRFESLILGGAVLAFVVAVGIRFLYRGLARRPPQGPFDDDPGGAASY